MHQEILTEKMKKKKVYTKDSPSKLEQMTTTH